MDTSNSRRNFFKGAIALPVLTALGSTFAFSALKSQERNLSHKFKLSLNLFSFNTLLREGRIDLFDMLLFCAEHNFDAIDPTGYYFPGYPESPSDEYINRFKREAFLLGLDISGTGIRNNLGDPEPAKRQADIELIKKWVDVAAKMGSPNLRIFTGKYDQGSDSREQRRKRIVEDIRICCEYGKRNGVVIALQNHNEFLKSANEVNELFEKVGSEWLGLNLDIGSYRQKDPYEEIAENIRHAVTWQIKENVWVDGKEQKTDFVKLFKIIKKAQYRGYLPLETLGEGDPFQKVAVMLKEVKRALQQI